MPQSWPVIDATGFLFATQSQGMPRSQGCHAPAGERQARAGCMGVHPVHLLGLHTQQDLELGLMLCYHCLGILANFIFELVFYKCSPMGKWSVSRAGI